MAKILEQLEEVAQVAPDMNSEQLRQQYSPEKIRETEMSLQELSRLNDLRTQQQRELDGYVEGSQPYYSNSLILLTSDEMEDENEDDYEPEEIMNQAFPKSPETQENRDGEQKHSEKSASISEEHLDQDNKTDSYHIQKSDVEEILLGVEDEEEDRELLGVEDEEEKDEQEEPRIVKCSFESKPLLDKSKRKKDRRQRISKESSTPESTPESRSKSQEEPDQSTTMFENRLFDFDDVASSSSKKPTKKGTQKVEEYETPSILEFPDPSSSSNNKDACVPDTKRY